MAPGQHDRPNFDVEAKVANEDGSSKWTSGRLGLPSSMSRYLGVRAAAAAALTPGAWVLPRVVSSVAIDRTPLLFNLYVHDDFVHVHLVCGVL